MTATIANASVRLPLAADNAGGQPQQQRERMGKLANELTEPARPGAAVDRVGAVLQQPAFSLPLREAGGLRAEQDVQPGNRLLRVEGGVGGVWLWHRCDSAHGFGSSWDGRPR